jgi:hypothetical protein
MSQIDPFDPPAPNLPKPPAPPTQQTPSFAKSTQVGLGEQPDIVPWGPPGSGKTTLLATMLYMLKMRARNPEKRLYYHVYPANEEAREFEDREVADLQKGILPQPTRVGDPSAMRSRMFYIGCRDQGDGLLGRFHRLLLMDAAGEETNPNSPYDTVYWQRIREARGVLMVINGADTNPIIKYRDGTEQNYETLITNFLSKVRQKSFSYKPFVAVCLAQSDRFYSNPEETYQTVLTPREAHEMNKKREKPVEHFKRLIGDDTFNYFRDELGENSFQIFITSATGWCRDPKTGEWQPNTIQDPVGWRLRATGDKWWTIGVLYPLMWLFDKIEEVRYREQRADKELVKYYLQKRITNQTILQQHIALPDHHPYWL